MRPDILIADEATLQAALAHEFQCRAGVAMAARRAFIVALPGGSLAKAYFPTLAKANVDWSRTEFFWTDERGVPPDHPESNYALASRLWLKPAGVPGRRIHRLCGEEADLDRAARAASEELRAIAGNPPRLDLALVGIGEDGHVASIFPGRSDVGNQMFAAVLDAPKPPSRRLTMTLEVLCGAARVIVSALGRSKAAPVREALEDGDCDTPVAELLRSAPSALLLLDHEAARIE